MPAKNKSFKVRGFVKRLIFATNIVAIAFLLCAFLAWNVSPMKTALFSYIGILFPFIFFINICYLILWIFFSKWKLALITISALIICYQPICAYFPMNLHPKTTSEKTIKVLTYNVMGFYHESNKQSPKHPILNFIRQSDADIVCLQEYMVSKTGKSMMTQKDIDKILSDYPYKSITGLEASGKYHIYGLACFSKFPIKNTHEIVFNSSYNGATAYTLDVEGKPITLVNAHLESNQISESDKKLYKDFLKNRDSEKLDKVTSNIRMRLGRAYRKRAEQVHKINAYLEEQQPETTIICGDFNDTPISYAYHTLRKNDLKDAFASTGFGMGVTYNEKMFLFRIDYILHSKNLNAYKAKVHNVTYSDHYPLTTYLAWIDNQNSTQHVQNK